MPYRTNPSYANQFYHVYNRGNNHGNIFVEERNYSYFLIKIAEVFQQMDLIAFCFMPNHFHLVVRTLEDKSLEKAMQKLSTAYTRAINKAYNRTGHLFEGRYKNKIIPNDEYLVHVCRYIHLNPVKAGLVNYPSEYKFSSYNYYLNNRELKVLNKEILNCYFKSQGSFVDFHTSFQENSNYYVSELLF